MNGPSLSRRSALQAVATIAGTLYGHTVTANQYGRVMRLVLDDVQTIEVRYRGKTVTIHPGAVIDALSAKEE